MRPGGIADTFGGVDPFRAEGGMEQLDTAAHPADLPSGRCRRRRRCRCAGAQPSAAERGPVVASPAEPRQRNAIGSYSGAYAIYRALAVATRALARDHRPDLTDTAPAALIAPRPQWADPGKIVSLDP